MSDIKDRIKIKKKCSKGWTEFTYDGVSLYRTDLGYLPSPSIFVLLSVPLFQRIQVYESISASDDRREKRRKKWGEGGERERGEKRMHRQPDGGPGASREPGKRKLRTDSGRCYRFESSHVSLSLSSLVTSSCLASCRTWVIVSFHRFISFTSLSIN